MPVPRDEALVRYAVELEERDLDVAAQLERIDGLAQRTASVREQATGVAIRLEGLPGERAAATVALESAQAAETRAHETLRDAEERHASLGRRASQSERDQAARELTRATEELHDAAQRRARAVERIEALGDLDRTLRAEADRLVVAAGQIAGEIAVIPSVSDAGKGDSGRTLAEVEDWGARARAALFVARGALATERERIVTEANILGASVLGEPLGGSSATLVRRRLEQHLAASGSRSTI